MRAIQTLKLLLLVASLFGLCWFAAADLVAWTWCSYVGTKALVVATFLAGVVAGSLAVAYGFASHGFLRTPAERRGL